MAINDLTGLAISMDLVDEARLEAALCNRSLSGQVEHWARLGQLAESIVLVDPAGDHQGGPMSENLIARVKALWAGH